MQVSNGTFMDTVYDDHIFHAANRYLGGLHAGPVIAESDSIAWAVRKNAPELTNHMNGFLFKHFRIEEGRETPQRSAFLNVLRKKYFVRTKKIAGQQIAE